jgi:predicted nucleic acid-binding protein
MSSEGRHFIDTNIVIGFTIEWDHFNEPSQSHLTDSSVRVHTSDYVLDEARNKIEGCRRDLRQAVDLINSEFEPGNDWELINDIRKFLTRELNNPSSPVIDYITHHENLFHALAQDPTQTTYNELLDKIQDDFRLPILLLRRFQKDDSSVVVIESQSGNYPQLYPSKYSELKKEMSNPHDREILFDAFHLLQSRSYNILLFATFDSSDFIEDKDQLEETLTGIQIIDPRLHHTDQQS